MHCYRPGSPAGLDRWLFSAPSLPKCCAVLHPAGLRFLQCLQQGQQGARQRLGLITESIDGFHHHGIAGLDRGRLYIQGALDHFGQQRLLRLVAADFRFGFQEDHIQVQRDIPLPFPFFVDPFPRGIHRAVGRRIVDGAPIQVGIGLIREEIADGFGFFPAFEQLLPIVFLVMTARMLSDRPVSGWPAPADLQPSH